jgi:hypothetical protein
MDVEQRHERLVRAAPDMPQAAGVGAAPFPQDRGKPPDVGRPGARRARSERSERIAEPLPGVQLVDAGGHRPACEIAPDEEDVRRFAGRVQRRHGDQRQFAVHRDQTGTRHAQACRPQQRTTRPQVAGEGLHGRGDEVFGAVPPDGMQRVVRAMPHGDDAQGVLRAKPR